jgi:NAD+ kinase
MRFGIYSNLTRDDNGKATLQLAAVLKKKGLPFALSSDLSCLNFDCQYLPNEDLAAFSDIIFVFGGDGTILRIVQECAKHDCAIFAINLGNLGFLTEIERSNLEKSIDLICKNKTKTEKREMLEVTFRNKKYLALNELVIARGSRAKMVYLDIMVDNQLMNRTRSDGLIVSTPTGSTAYSLSAGGPIVTPDVSAFVLTPICPHSFKSRPFVISNEREVKIYLLRADPSAFLNLDGEDVAEMQVGESVAIARSNLTAKFVRLEGYNYFDNISQKLNNCSFSED